MKKRSWFRRLLLVGLLLAVGLPLLVFGLSNLYLLSPFAGSLIGSKITQKTGLSAKLKNASWSPWNGFNLYQLEIQQPELLRESIALPLFTAEHIRLKPHWIPLLKHRKLNLSAFDADQPQLNFPIELFSLIPHQPTEPELASKAAPLSPSATPGQPDSDLAENTVKPAETASIQPKTTTTPAPPASELPTVWANFSQAGFRIVSVQSQAHLYEVSGITGKLPLQGKAVQSEISLQKINFLGSQIGNKMSFPVSWKPPFLQLGKIEGKILGIENQLQANIGLFGSIPFQINSVIPEQNDVEIQISEPLQAKIGQLTGSGRLQGQLLSPSSWQGQWMSQCKTVSSSHSGQTIHFEHGQALALFANGSLNFLDARLIGESLSILGNGSLLSDGRLAANARLVAKPASLVAISKYTEPESAAPTLTPLSTPQRSALDLSVYGRLGELFYLSNPEATPTPLFQQSGK